MKSKTALYKTNISKKTTFENKSISKLSVETKNDQSCNDKDCKLINNNSKSTIKKTVNHKKPVVISQNWKKMRKQITYENKIRASKIRQNIPRFEDNKSQTIEPPGSITEIMESRLIKNGPIALDCEMVGGGLYGDFDILARVSVVNENFETILDTYVSPREKVVDYRTAISGVRKEHLVNAPSFIQVQKMVTKLLEGRILVGHSLKNDFKVLHTYQDKKLLRDTSVCRLFRKYLPRSKMRPSLKMLAKTILNKDIQQGSHDSVEDAKICMMIYKKSKSDWEELINSKKKKYKKTKLLPEVNDGIN